MRTHFTALIVLLLFTELSYSQIGSYSLYFDGVNDYISIPHSSNLNFTAFTIEAWVCRVGSNSGKIMGKTSSNAAVPGFNMGIETSGVYTFEVYSTWSSYVKGSTDTSIKNTSGVWTHMAMTWSSGGYMKGYVNGVEVMNLASGSFSITNSTSMIIGMAPWYTLSQGYYNGKMDEVRVWNVVRTQSEIKANMYRELAGNETGLRAYYKMSNGSGTSLTDNQSNVTSNTGTINGAVWRASGCFTGPKKCLDFDGTNDYVSLPNTFANNSMTVELWACASDWNVSSSFKSIIGNSQSGGWKVYLQNSQLCVDVCLSTGSTSTAVYNSTNLSGWNHLAFTADATSLKLYVNGIPVTTSVTGNTFMAPGEGVTTTLLGTEMAANNFPDNNYFSGKIDEVRIWNSVRTESELKENMMNTLSGNESGLQAYYRMDYSDGTTCYDVTSNSRNGTLTNMDPASDWINSTAFNTWLGTESNSWSTASNWSRGSVPASTDNIGVYKWTLGNELTLSGTPTLSHLFFSSTSSPVLGSNFTVNGTFVLNRNIDLNGYTITIGSGGNLSEGNYRIYGSSGTITTTRTITNVSGFDAGGLGAVITTSGNMGSTTITRGHSSQGSGVGILRYYEITPSVNTGLNATLTFKYSENELNGNNESDLKLFKSTDNGASWFLQNASAVDIGSNTITLTGIDGFSKWTAANYNSPLPVEMISLTSEVSGRNVTLIWKTGSETDNSGFLVERRVAAGNWETAGFVKGGGTTNEPSGYSFTDKNLKTGEYFYRLKQIDYNGNCVFHNLKNSLVIGIPSRFKLGQNYPNPFNPSSKIDFDLPEESVINIRVYDITGKEVIALLQNEKRSAGYHTVEIDGSRLSSGIYFCRLSSGKFNAVRRIILLK